MCHQYLLLVGAARAWISMDHLKRYWPVLVTLGISIGYVLFRLIIFQWDPVGLAELAVYSEDGSTVLKEGYDGQFFYHIAVSLSPEELITFLDVPAYRFQRILYPLLAHIIGLGNPVFIPWTLIGISLIAHLIGTGALSELLRGYGVWIGYSLIYSLWVGVVGPIGLDLSEPLAFALVIGGLLARSREKHVAGAFLLTAAMFAKETTAIFWLAALVADLLAKNQPARSIRSLLLGGSFFAIWQLVLFLQFGSFGIGSGGAMATPFEVIPFMGLWRIGYVSLPALLLFLAIFGPTILVPTVWALIASIRALAEKHLGINSWSLLFNALLIVALPFSTFREPLGLVRIATGLVLAITCFAAEFGISRVLNYSMFLIAFLFLLVNG
jgi:hypothetical protein